MNRVRIFSVFLIALVAGGGLAYGTYDYLQNVPVKTVTVPTQRSSSRTRISRSAASCARTISRPSSGPQARCPKARSRILGDSRPRADPSVLRHEPILPASSRRKRLAAGCRQSSRRKRAVSVRVNEVIGVGGYVLPGTHVDVVATQSPTSRNEDMTSKVVLSNVQVLTAGTRLEHDSKDGKPVQVTVVTLVVTPDQAERLTLASTEGKIQLALRNPLDLESPETAGVKPGCSWVPLSETCARCASHPRPLPLPAPAFAQPAPTVEIIPGDKRQHVTVG